MLSFDQLYDTDNEVAMEAADVIDEACEDEVSWARVWRQLQAIKILANAIRNVTKGNKQASAFDTK